MIRFIYIGDIHLRGNNPVNRKDDYKKASMRKLKELFDAAKYHKVEAILCSGDFFDHPTIHTTHLVDFIDFFKKNLDVPFITAVGNHDIYGYNIDTLKRSSLKVMESAVDNISIIDSEKCIDFNGMTERVVITAQEYSVDVDVDGKGYQPKIEVSPEYFNIHIVHGMLMDHEAPFDHTLIEDVRTTANLVLTGHDHNGYGVAEKRDTLFANIGSVMRSSASESEIARMPKYAVITINGNNCDIDVKEFISAEAGEDVLDRSNLKAKQEREERMNAFTAKLKDGKTLTKCEDIEKTVMELAQGTDISDETIQRVLDKISLQKEKLGENK